VIKYEGGKNRKGGSVYRELSGLSGGDQQSGLILMSEPMAILVSGEVNLTGSLNFTTSLDQASEPNAERR
jgi:hypothetical protein